VSETRARALSILDETIGPRPEESTVFDDAERRMFAEIDCQDAAARLASSAPAAGLGESDWTNRLAARGLDADAARKVVRRAAQDAVVEE
jgi:hypothetical protein